MRYLWTIFAVAAAAAETGSFNILSMNVAGLPEVLQGNDETGDKATNAATIGAKFAEYNYDIIHVQEDFNYHAYIYAADNHTDRTATSGGAGIGSGLNTLANFAWVDFTREKWDTCSDASGDDCLTPKGFTFMRMFVDEVDGVFIDVYNLHADAGTEDDDETARSSNLQQVADYIDTWSVGNAVLVFGDTNSRYSRAAADGIEVFQTQNGLTDAWVQLERGGVIPTVLSLCDNPSTTDDCETVDKVFYRGSAILNLTATAFHYDSARFLQSDNSSVLSDHNPVHVEFVWSLSDELRQSAGYWGGPHGTWFSDLPALSALLEAGTTPQLRTIKAAGGSRLDSVGVILDDGTTFSHGGDGGTAVSLTLTTGEYWVSAKLCQGQKNGKTRVFSLLATTSTGRTLGAGTTTSNCTTFAAPDGWQIVGYLGQDGDEIDQLGFIYGLV